MEVKLQNITPEPELTILRIARVSSSRKDKDEEPEKLINYLIHNNHWSPFEHAMITLEIKTSKAMGIQLLRHRSFTFQEFSQRYAKVTEIEPIEIRKQADKNRQSSEQRFNPKLPKHSYLNFEGTAELAINHFIAVGQKLYEHLLEAGVAKECARMILPMAYFHYYIYERDYSFLDSHAGYKGRFPCTEGNPIDCQGNEKNIHRTITDNIKSKRL